MRDLDLIAKMKSTTEFIERAADTDVAALRRPDGTGLLMAALGNTDTASRYATTHWLLDRGCRPGPPNSEGDTELHVLFAHVKHDVSEDVKIATRLIELGADVNAVSPRNGLVFCDVLWMKFTDEDLEPIYRLWFDQPVRLDFETPAKRGRDPLGLARALPYRASILERMENYLRNA